jgi:hypothetical protein
MPGKIFLLATIIPFFFYNILDLMLLLFGRRQMIIGLLLLTYTLNCSAALAVITHVHGERSVNTCRYFNRMYQKNLNHKQLPKAIQLILSIVSNRKFLL